jgi:drug/metabolite transporter (DMT)-like permease
MTLPEVAMRHVGGRPVLAMTAGAACIAWSAIFMRLAASSASMTSLLRCGLALPLLGLLVWRERRGGAPAMTRRNRWLARLAGVFLAVDLTVWSHAIDEIGAGLGTVTGNLQVVITAVLAWVFLGERPRASLLIAAPALLGGLVLVGGFVGSHAYGADPGLGVLLGASVAVLYSIYILLLRQAATRASIAEPLFEATLGATVGSLVLGLALGDLWLAPDVWPALGWLTLLALTSQVLGWLLITTSMPRLPAWLIGALLLIQPAGSVALGAVVLGEHPSAWQLAGTGLMLAGVLIAAAGAGSEISRAGSPASTTQHSYRNLRVKQYLVGHIATR